MIVFVLFSKVSKVAAVFVGGLFLIIQSLSYRGYVKVDHKLIRRDFEVSSFVLCLIDFVCLILFFV